MNNHTCNTCGEVKSEDNFSWRSKAKGIRSGKCKACHKAYMAEHYRANKDLYMSRSNARRPAQKAAARKHIKDYLESHPCVDCGESDPIVLEFDHREMVGPNHRRVTGLNSIKAIDREIALCDVRCANCHTRRTKTQMSNLWGERAGV